MLNIELIGNICQDAVVKTVSEKTLIEFKVAVNEKVKGIDTVIFISCAKWGESTKVIDYLKKGKKVFVRGQLSVNTYSKQSADIGINISCTVITLELLSSGAKKDDLPE